MWYLKTLRRNFKIWKSIHSFQTVATHSQLQALGLILLLGALGRPWVRFIRVLRLGRRGCGHERQRVALEDFGGDVAVVELLEGVLALVERVDLALEDVKLFLLFLKHSVEVLADFHSGGGAKWHAIEELGRAVGGVTLGCSNDGLGVGVQCQLELAALVQGHAAEEVGVVVVVETFLVPILLLRFGSNRLHRCIKGGEQVRKREFFQWSPGAEQCIQCCSRHIARGHRVCRPYQASR